jgi:hypothetical protein
MALGELGLPLDEPPLSDVLLLLQFLALFRAAVARLEGDGLAIIGPDSLSAITVAAIQSSCDWQYMAPRSSRNALCADP